MDEFPRPPFPQQQQEIPGTTGAMNPRPDHGEESYRGTGRLKDKKVLITGGDSGIGRAVALAFAREGADLLVSYLDEEEDAAETQRLVEEAGQRCVLVAGDIGRAAHCRSLVERAVQEFGRIDVLVNNAAHQMSFNSPEEISDEEWNRTFAVNISAMFYLVKAATPHMRPGSAIINTASSTPTARAPTCLPTPPPRAPSKILPADSHSFSPTRASGSMPWRPVRSGHHSFPRRCRRSMWRISARITRSSGRRSRASSRPFT